MENSNGKKTSIVTIILAIVVIALLAYIVYSNVVASKNDVSTPVVNESTEKIVSNKTIKVVDSIEFEEYEGEKRQVVKIENISSETFKNVTPTFIFYDSNGMPVQEGWGASIRYFEPGAVRSVIIYDAIEDYSRMEVGLFDREDFGSKEDVEDLRDKITYEVEESKEADEDGELHITFKGKNNSDKEVSLNFEIGYYDGDKWFYEDDFSVLAEAKEEINTYELLKTKYANGKAFPEGYKYEVKLVEATEAIGEIGDDEEEYEDSAAKKTTKGDVELSIEDEIESALFDLLKENYGEKMSSAKIYVGKVYTPAEVEKNEAIKSLNLGKDDHAFECTIYIEPAEGVDPEIFLVPNGNYDKDSGWVQNISRLGVLRATGKEDPKYKITDYGTGW